MNPAMDKRTRITHESLLRLISATADDTSAPGSRHFHAGGWSVRPVANPRAGEANWTLFWHEDGGTERHRAAIEEAVATFAKMYDVVW